MKKPARVRRIPKVCADTPGRIFREEGKKKERDEGTEGQRIKEKAVALPIGSIQVSGHGTF